ncbi:MAG: hypothetical protein AABZ55_00395 [Bdellovibrionota bacterium]
MPNNYFARLGILFTSAAIAVVTIAGGYYSTYRIVTLIGNN